MAKKVKEISRNMLIFILAAVIILIAYLIYRIFGSEIVDLFELVGRGDQAEISAYLNSRGQFGGYLALFLICILQVISIFFPGMVIQISGALIYGWWRAFLICWFGFVFGNALVFTVAKVFGKSIAIALSSQDQKQNWLIDKINNGNQVFVVAFACLIPGVPNGIIPYLASRTKISLKDFILAVAGSSWVQIILNCIAGHFLIRGQYFFMILSFAIQILIIIYFTKNREKILKKNS